MGVNVKPLQLHTVYKRPYSFLLNFIRESLSGATSHARICVRYYKSRTLRLNVQWNRDSYDKIIITIVPSCTGRYHSFVANGIVTHVTHSKQYRWQQKIFQCSWYLCVYMRTTCRLKSVRVACLKSDLLCCYYFAIEREVTSTVPTSTCCLVWHQWPLHALRLWEDNTWNMYKQQ